MLTDATETSSIIEQSRRVTRVVVATVLATILAAIIALVAAADAPAVESGPAAAAAPDIVFTRHVRGIGRADVYSMKADGSLLRRLTRDGVSAGATFSPDGERIAFVSGRAHGLAAPELYVMDADGANVRRLTRSDWRPRSFWQNTQPAWSPDGRSIVFVRTRVAGTGETTDLWRVPASGGRPVRLTRHPGREANPTFSPDGTVGFDRDGWIRRLTAEGVVDVRRGADPAWSPDRTYLAFVKDGAIYLTVGQSERRIVERGAAPAWSPEGTQLVYSTADGGLHAVSVRGVVTQRLSAASARTEDIAPAWRPARRDARSAAPAARSGLIAFARRTGTGTSALYVVRPDGTGLRRLSAQPVDFDPTWTPDGRRLVFASSRDGRAGAAELYSRDLAGRSIVRLTRTAAATDDWSANVEPAVRPDGRRVVFVRERYRSGTTTRDLYSVPIDGGAPTRLSRSPGREASPSLGRSGALYFERDGWIFEEALGQTRRVARGVQPAKDPSHRGLVAFARAGAIYVSWGGTPEKIAAPTAAGGLSEPAWSPDGERLVYVGPDGLYVVDRDGGNRRRLTKNASLTHDLAPAWRPAA